MYCRTNSLRNFRRISWWSFERNSWKNPWEMLKFFFFLSQHLKEFWSDLLEKISHKQLEELPKKNLKVFPKKLFEMFMKEMLLKFELPPKRDS